MLVVALLLLQAVAPPQSQADAERLFALGQHLYAEGDPSGAVAAFEGALATGWTGAALHYNLGTACLDTDDLGCAVYHLTKAERIDRDTRTAHNLRIARERAGLARTPGRSPLATLGAVLGRSTLLVVGYGLFLGGLGLLGFRLWTRRREAWLRRTLVAALPLAVAVLGLGLAVWMGGRSPEAIILTETVLSARPGTTEGRPLAPGRLLRLGDAQDGWVEASLPDGSTGWVLARALGVL